MGPESVVMETGVQKVYRPHFKNELLLRMQVHLGQKKMLISTLPLFFYSAKNPGPCRLRYWLWEMCICWETGEVNVPDEFWQRKTLDKNLSVHLRLGATPSRNIRAPESLKPKLFLHFDPTFICQWGFCSEHLSHQLFWVFFFSPPPLPDWSLFPLQRLHHRRFGATACEMWNGVRPPTPLLNCERRNLHLSTKQHFQPTDLSPWNEAGMNFKRPPVLYNTDRPH